MTTSHPNPMNFAPGAAVSGGPDIRAISLRLLRCLPLIVVLSVLGAGAGFWVKSLLPPRYTSSVSILIDPKRPGAVGADGAFANLYVDSNKITSVVSILESTVLLKRVVQTEKLADEPEFGDRTPTLLERVLGRLLIAQPKSLPPDADGEREMRALDRLSQAVKVNRIGMTYVIEVDVALKSPALAQRVARAMADAYLTDQLETKFEAARRDSLWLAGRLVDLRNDLRKSEEEVQNIRQRYHLMETDQPGPNATVGRQQVTSLSAEIARVNEEVLARQARFENARRIELTGGNLAGLPEVTTSGVIAALRGKQADVDRTLADLTDRYTPNSPEVKRAENERRAIERQIGAEISRIVSSFRTEYDSAVAHRRALESELSHLSAAEGGAVSTEGTLRLREAQRQVEANRGLYENFLSRLREVEQQQTRQEVEARIIDPANFPYAQSFPKPLMFVAIGGGAGFAIAFGLAFVLPLFVLPLFSASFRDATDAERMLALPVLGAVPMLRRRDITRNRKRLDVVEYAAALPLSRFSESLRALRFSLFARSDGRTMRVIQLTSAVPGEGKSMLAAALAVSTASAGLRTALVDADMHGASLSGLFKINGQRGLADALAGAAQIDSLCKTFDNLPLTFLGAGSSARVPSDLLSTSRFKAVLDTLAADHDVVIVDSPPVLAVSDACLTALHADATVLVVEWQATPRAVVAQAVAALRAVRAPLAGIVLNKIDVAQVGAYGHGWDSYRKYIRTISKYYSG